METYTFIFAGLYAIALTYWMVRKRWKITLNLFQGKIELEPPPLFPPPRKNDGYKPGGEYNRLEDSNNK